MTPPILPASEWEPKKPGLFQLHERLYRSAPGISQSALKHLRKSPKHCLHAMENHRKPTRAMEMGTALHTLLLEPDRFGIGKSHWIRPNQYRATDGTEKPWNANSKTCKQWLAEHADLPVFKGEEMDNIGGMVQELMAHPQARPALSTGYSELAAFWQDEETGLWIKARLDRLIQNGAGDLGLVDVKKCQDAEAWSRTDAYDLGCHIQAASNMDICLALGVNVQFFMFIAVEEKPPHGVVIHNARDLLTHGRAWHRYLLDLYAQCVEDDKWPGYSEEIRMMKLPGYAELPKMPSI